jgi:HD-GYP domain-containing protein (c-di-GMP phosphodiesterase class II)
MAVLTVPYLLIAVGAWLVAMLFVIAILRAASEADKALEARSVSSGSALARWVQLVFAQDPAKAQHAAAVAHYALRLAGAAEFPRHEQRIIHTAGLLHGIDEPGFTGPSAPDPRELDPAVRALVERHAARGVHMLRDLRGFEPVAEIVGREAAQLSRGERR